MAKKSSSRNATTAKSPQPSSGKPAASTKPAKSLGSKGPAGKAAATGKSKPVKPAKAAAGKSAPALRSPKQPVRGKPAGGSTSSKISKPPVTAIAQPTMEPPEPPTAAELRKTDSGLTKQEKAHYRKELFIKRAEILGAVDSLTTAALTDGGNLSNMPLHMADVGSDQYEQEAMLGLVESERRLLREIDEALHRIEDGTYGVCIESGKPIGKPRLDIQPWAKYCIEVVRERERTGRR